MAKRTTDTKDERIRTLESALAWAMPMVPAVALETRVSSGCHWQTQVCPHCHNEGRQNHTADCPYDRANDLLKGLKPRKWEKK